jgi:hypothetical protein
MKQIFAIVILDLCKRTRVAAKAATSNLNSFVGLIFPIHPAKRVPEVEFLCGCAKLLKILFFKGASRCHNLAHCPGAAFV